MANTEIKLKVTIDNKEAVASLQLTDDNIRELYQSFKYGQQEVNGFTTAVSRGFNNAREIFQGVRETFSALQTAFGSLLAAYGEQELNEVKLQTALKQTGNYTEQTMQELNKYASTLQSITMFGDEAYLSVFGMLQAMGLSVEQTKQAAMQTANLATLMGTDLNSAVRVMGDLFAGDATMITRYIKGLDETIIKSGDTAKIVEYLNTRIGGQAEEAAKSGAGAIVQMGNALSDVQENAGMLLSKALNPLIAGVRDFITWLNNTHPVIGATVLSVGTLGAALVALQVTGIMGATTALVTGLIPAIKSLYVTMALWSMYNPLTAGLLAVTALAAGIAAVISAKQSEIETVQESIGVNIEDNNLQKQKISNNISLLETENALINKANDLYNSSNKLKAGSEERVKKETELKGVLNDLMKLNPGLITAGNTFAESMNILNTKRQSNITKEKEYQIELDKTIAKLKELSQQKFWADYSAKVEELTKNTGESLFGFDTELTAKFKNAAFTGSVDERIKNLESLKNLTKSQLSTLADGQVKFYGAAADEFKSSVNELLTILIGQKNQITNELLTKTKKTTDGDGGKKDPTENKEFETQKQQAAVLKELELARANDLEVELIKLDEWYMDKYEIIKDNEEALNDLRQIYDDKQKSLMSTASLLEISQPKDTELDMPEGLGEVGDPLEFKRLNAREEIDLWEKTQAEKYSLFANNEDMMKAVTEEASLRRQELDRQEAEMKKQMFMDTLSVIAQGVGRHTVLGKAAAVAMATMNTSEAITKALTVGPILGPILAGVVGAMGAVQVKNILSTKTPGYAEGGRLEQGKAGYIEGWHNEIVAPERTFVDIMRTELIPKVITSIPIIQNNNLERMFEKQFEKMNNWQRSLTLKAKGNDLVTVYDETKMINLRETY